MTKTNNINNKKKIFFCKLKDLKKKKFIVKYIDEFKDEIIIFFDNEAQVLKSFSSVCPHFGGEVVYDYKINNLICNWHGWKFCKNSGKCLSHPIKSALRKYNFIVNPNNLKEYEVQLISEKIYVTQTNE